MPSTSRQVADMNSHPPATIGGVLIPRLVEEIQDKLIKGTVDCMICYDNVSRSAPIWSCSCCFSIFHLHCIKRWARAEGFTWGCPGCRSEQLISSKDMHYVCFCGKRRDPPWDPYLTPHSCGEPCGKENARDDVCRHRCVLRCHPGPCPPCKAYAPLRVVCPCGKKVVVLRCSDQDSFTCGQPCGKPIECLRHYCEKTCHLGPCDFCDLLVDVYCFCKKKTEAVVCGKIMAKGQVNEEADGFFSCGLPCGKPLACGNHVCKETCHPGVCGECDLLPARVTSCSCGKTSSLQEEKPRYSCLDPIPTCSQICGKTLPCGLHGCKVTCHPGPCPPCQKMVTKKCRCGSTSRSVECSNTTMEFTCDKTCGRLISCGRHHCVDKCCPLLNSNNVPHLCSKPCKKKLRCGQHDCGLLCHSGHCPPCPERIFNDLTCACGRTSIQPPQPCGTPPPICQYPCLLKYLISQHL